MDHLSDLLKASIAHEQNKAKDDFNMQKQMAQRIVQLEDQIKKMNGVIGIMCKWTEEPLQAIENIVKTDPSLLDYEAMADYVMIARFMEAYTGRRSMVSEVEKRMRELPS